MVAPREGCKKVRLELRPAVHSWRRATSSSSYALRSPRARTNPPPVIHANAVLASPLTRWSSTTPVSIGRSPIDVEANTSRLPLLSCCSLRSLNLRPRRRAPEVQYPLRVHRA